MLKTGAAWLGQIGNGVRDLLFPPSCIVCHCELVEGAALCSICADCLRALSLVEWPVCQRCAARVPELPGTVPCCSRCQRDKLAFDRGLALGSYDGLLRDLVLRMKKDRSELLAAAFGQLIQSRLGEALTNLSLDAIVPIPMPLRRRLSRGTNPPAALAEVLGRKLAVPTFPGLLTKPPNTSPQLGLSRAGRFQNIRGQIGIRAGYSLETPHVLLVDDVLTTGATCSEAAKVLKRQGAREVTVLVVGRTPNH